MIQDSKPALIKMHERRKIGDARTEKSSILQKMLKNILNSFQEFAINQNLQNNSKSKLKIHQLGQETKPFYPH